MKKFSALLTLLLSAPMALAAKPDCLPSLGAVVKPAAATKGMIMVLSAPSGGGKTTIADALTQRFPNSRRSVSVTTRAPRGTEVDGKDYVFKSNQEFDDMLAKNEFAEWAMVHGNRYGTTKQSIQDALDKGELLFLIIDVVGAKNIKASFPEAQLVFVQPPDMKTLEARLRGRGTDTDEVIQKRLANAKAEIAQASFFDHQVVNDDLQRALGEMETLIKKYRQQP